MNEFFLMERVKELRRELYNKELKQDEIDKIVTEISPFKNILGLNDGAEPLLMVDKDGESLNIEAPRWIFHLLGLKHKAVHLLLYSRNDVNDPVFILQVRSFTKFEYPGHLDMSVGGHVIGNESSHTTVLKEMEEELGIQIGHLLNSNFYHINSYMIEDIKPEINLYNCERRDLYIAEIDSKSIGSINFKDNEVAGLYLCPLSSVKDLLDHTALPLTHALKESLPKCLNFLTILMLVPWNESVSLTDVGAIIVSIWRNIPYSALIS
ncbi:MAG TPA: NUDIX domain-containing protein [Pedobacter sp.]|uniref:NUDIX domain-containing protein n=1 Tax=Pedobacter sp. TaxID=1411316 RepID=UPI002CCEE6AA|nr:NUDIX domain-containing protein [Pedobacter sp.]HMI04706.1 NUDIX domain-containing protein [Pedobacter sp.]